MDDENNKARLTISQFGRLSQLSRKALRLYDQRGLLPPARIDPDSGYRYYGREQVTLARRIRLLRTLGMALDGVGQVLAAWDDDPATAARLVRAQVTRAEKQLESSRLFARLLLDELTSAQESTMQFDITKNDMPTQTVVSIRRHITVPAFHQWIRPALEQLWGHIKASGAKPTCDPLALYYGPVNEEDDGPVEICVPFEGTVPPAGEIRVRQLPAHTAVQLRTYGEYNEYPKLLEMWDAVGRYVHDNQLESNWDHDMTTYELWHEDMSMTISWPVRDKGKARGKRMKDEG
jgi:DNA-binding transcriptional MerR regulator